MSEDGTRTTRSVAPCTHGATPGQCPVASCTYHGGKP